MVLDLILGLEWMAGINMILLLILDAGWWVYCRRNRSEDEAHVNQQ